MSYLFLILFLITISCNSVSRIDCDNDSKHIYLGNGSTILPYSLIDNKVDGKPTEIYTKADSIPFEAEVIDCVSYDAEPYYVIKRGSGNYLISKSISFKNAKDAIEFAKYLSSVNP